MNELSLPDHVMMTTETMGGLWSYAVDLSRELSQRGVHITMAALGSEPTDAQRAEVEAIAGLKLHARPFAVEWMERPWDEVAQAGEWLRELAAHIGPDIIHLNTLAHGALEWSAPVVTVGHSDVLSWHEAVHGEPAGEDWEHYRDVVQTSLQSCAMVVAPSATKLRQLQQHFGPLERTRVVYHGRDPRAFEPGTKEAAVLSAGRLWDGAKNVAAVAQAAEHICWPVYVAGSRTHPDGGTVDFAGVQALGELSSEELARWYARCTIFAMPARYEPFGLTVLEAAMAGNALVLGDIASLHEIWGQSAVFVDPDDTFALAEAINELIDDDARREHLAERAQQRALQLNARAMADRYVELYREMRQG